MRYENNEYLRRWLDEGGAKEYAALAHFDFEERALEAATAEVQQQHPYLSAPEARARAAYRLLTKDRRTPLPEGGRAWPAIKLGGQVAWAVAVLVALLLLALRAKAEPPRDLPPSVRAAVLARGLFAQEASGIIIQFQNQGSVLSTHPAGLVVLNCSTNMSCSFSGSTFTLTSSSTASTAFSAITTGTNTNTLTMGTGGTLAFGGTGIVNANQYKGGNASGTGSCGANLFVTGVNDAAAPTCTQPSFANLLGAATKAQLPATSVFTDQTNTYSAGTQDFESAAVTRPFRRLAFASFPATCTANREFLERSDPATAGQVVYVCNAAGTGWDLVGDGGGGGGVGGSGTANTVAKFTAATTLGNSSITDDGTTVSVQPTAGLVVPKHAGAAPTAQGDVRYDTTQDTTTAGGRGSIPGTFPRVLATFVCNSTVCVCTGSGCTSGTFTNNCVSGGADANCTNAGTSETNAGMNFSVPANFFKASKILRVTLGTEVIGSGVGTTATVRLKFGSTVVSNGAFNLPSVVVGEGLSLLVQGTAAPGASVNVETVPLGGMDALAASAGNNGGSGNINAQPIAIATNAAQTLQFSFQIGSATLGNFIRLRQMVIEELN
jgi:hypothetical protein